MNIEWNLKCTFLREININTQKVSPNDCFEVNIKIGNNITHILNRLKVMNTNGKERYLTQEEKALIVKECLNEGLIQLIKLNNRKIPILTQEGKKIILSSPFKKFIEREKRIFEQFKADLGFR